MDKLKKIADKYNLDISEFDPIQLIKGMRVEKEHDTDDNLDVVKNIGDLMKIAMAHLKEFPDYYTRLAKMEKEGVVNEDQSSKELLKDLENQLLHHDWSYAFSDDNRYYRAGEMQAQKIKNTLKKLHDAGRGKEARKLWDKYTKGMKYKHYPIKEATESGIEVYGVMGVKSKKFKKKFKSQKEFEKWLEKNDGNVEIYGSRDLDESKQTRLIVRRELASMMGEKKNEWKSILTAGFGPANNQLGPIKQAIERKYNTKRVRLKWREDEQDEYEVYINGSLRKYLRVKNKSSYFNLQTNKG